MLLHAQTTVCLDPENMGRLDVVMLCKKITAVYQRFLSISNFRLIVHTYYNDCVMHSHYNYSLTPYELSYKEYSVRP